MKRPKRRIDVASVGGLLVAIGGILGGLMAEGGRLSDVQQITAALIVLGGTLGAVMITTPLQILRAAARSLPDVFAERLQSRRQLLEQLIGYASRARRSGIVSLDAELDTISDPFVRKALMLAVDGTDIQQLRSMLELEMSMEEHKGEAVARVFESAGGYSPTIGIIGAVLGLIQVMKQLENIDEVGRGIAIAFVATVYGVGLANVILLPAANKLRARLASELKTKAMIVDGTVSIVEGLNPKLIASKLSAYLEDEPAPARRSRQDAAAAAGQQASA